MFTNISSESDHKGVFEGKIVSVGAEVVHGFGINAAFRTVANRMSSRLYKELCWVKYLSKKYELPIRSPKILSGIILIIRWRKKDPNWIVVRRSVYACDKTNPLSMKKKSTAK